jgi:large subunit ribosomal protein L3
MIIALRAIFFDQKNKNMINTLIGQKTDQAQQFLENGKRLPVTKISFADNFVLQVKTFEKDLYQAVQLGTGVKKKPTKATLGHAKKLGIDKTPLKIKEVAYGSVSPEDAPKPGDTIAIDSVFKPGDIVQVTGTSKGKGFAGGVKRHGFAGGPKTHGQSDRHRAPGSIGQGTTPGRVYKGKRMAGRMGSDQVTVKNLQVVDVDAENNILYVSGLIPGFKSSWVYVTKTGEDKNFVPLLSKSIKQNVDEAQDKDVAGTAQGPSDEAPKTKEAEDAQVGSKTQADTQSDAVEKKAEIVVEAQEAVGAPDEKAEEKVKVLEDQGKIEKEDEKSIDAIDSGESKTASVENSSESKEEKKDD